MSETTWIIPSSSVPFTSTPVVAGDGKINHIAKALSRLPEQLKLSSEIIALITALLSPAQEIEDMFFALLALRSIDDASDAVLDLIGKLVGQPRGGQLDPVYRQYIRVRVRVNKSRGLPSDYVKIVSLLYPTANIEVKAKGATAEVTVHGIAINASDASMILGFLQDAHGGGVRAILHTFPSPEAVTFSYRSVTHLLNSVVIHDRTFQVLTQTDLLSFPLSGYVKIDSEVIAYTLNAPLYTLFNVAVLGFASNHTAGALVILCDSLGNELNTGRGYGNGFYSSGLETNP